MLVGVVEVIVGFVELDCIVDGVVIGVVIGIGLIVGIGELIVVGSLVVDDVYGFYWVQFGIMCGLYIFLFVEDFVSCSGVDLVYCVVVCVEFVCIYGLIVVVIGVGDDYVVFVCCGVVGYYGIVVVVIGGGVIGIVFWDKVGLVLLYQQGFVVYVVIVGYEVVVELDVVVLVMVGVFFDQLEIVYCVVFFELCDMQFGFGDEGGVVVCW